MATPTPGTACNVPTYIVTVLPKPLLTPILGKDSVCDGQPYVYSVGSNTVGAFNWTVNNGTFLPLSGLADSIQVIWSGPSHSISVTQTSAAGCTSLPQTFSAAAYPTPVLSGAVSVCADNVETYSITNIGNHPFNWSVNPANLGTVISGQGTNVVQIKWHGSNLPGSSNTVYLHYGLCKDDSIAITINEPVLPVITRTGSLCTGGVNLSVAATGVFSWSCSEHAIVPTQPLNTSSIIGLTLPGHYTVTISNYNGSGCTVSNTYFVQDIGRPVASISASNVLNYCLPSTPNMNIVAAYALGYSYQWYGPGGPIGGPTINPTLPVNAGAFPILNTPGSYSFYVVVTLGGCVVTSNTITINIVTPCPNPNPGCTGAIAITNITGCNPFTLSLVATAPAGGVVLPLTATIFYTGPVYPATSGTTTRTFDSVGYKQITICADIALPGGGTTRCCKDTVVLVTVAAKYIANNNCGVVTLTDLSTVIFPAVISSYSWTNGTYPANLPVPPVVAVFNNSAIANPTDTFKVSGTYYINQTITSGACTVTYSDSITVIVPNATFTANNSCVGTPINLTAPGGFTSYYWDFGDAATSYTPTTAHAYAATGTYTITLTVTDANGCTATTSQTVNIIAKPVCAITPANPPPFCQGDSVVLNACPGFTGYQWFKNGAAIPSANGLTYTVFQTGSYSFTALNGFGCIVSSDTVDVQVNPAPNVVIATSGSICVGGVWLYSVPSCGTCTYVWKDNGVPFDNTNSGSYNILAAGVHVITVKVTNTTTGCSATGTTTVTFYDNPTVSISVMPNPPQLCSNNIYVLTATAGAIPPVSSPSWAWTYNPNNFVISTNNFISVNAAGTYNVTLTDGITGCKGTASQIVLPSPDLSLFPMGCDTLCDTAHVFLPLPTVNNNYAGYTITWYNNAPPYTSIIGTGPSISLASLPLGNNSISVIVVSPNGCVDTSNNYNIFIEHCGGCSCDSSYWGETTWEQDTAQVINPIENIIIPHVIHPFKCGDNLGNISCTNPVIIKASFHCKPASCDSLVKYNLTGPVTATGFMPFSTAGLPTGNYVLTMIGKCGDSVCKVCTVLFHISCDTVTDCCTNSHWILEPSYVFYNYDAVVGGITGENPQPTLIPVNCSVPGTVIHINNALNNCNKAIGFKATLSCPDTCQSNVIIEVLDSTNTVLFSGPSPSTVLFNLLPNGNYTVIYKGYCGGTLCKVCSVSVVKNCRDCCEGSYFEDIIIGEAPFDDPAGVEVVTDTVRCGANVPDTIYIDPAHNNCNKLITIKSGFHTPDSCDLRYVFELSFGGAVIDSGVLLYTAGGYAQMNITWLPSTTFPVNGIYTLCFKAYIGGVLCKQCCITIVKNCPPNDCCTNSHWEQSPTWLSTTMQNGVGVGTSTPIICNQSNFSISNAVGNCTLPTSVVASYVCGSIACTSNVEFKLYNTVGNVLVASSTSSPFTIPTSLPNGSYCITIYAYCNGVICDSCKFCFVKNCGDCCAESHWDSSGYTSMWQTGTTPNNTYINTLLKMDCSPFIPDTVHITNALQNCNVYYDMAAEFICPPGCQSHSSIVIKDAFGNVIDSATDITHGNSNGAITYIFGGPVLANGTYTVTFNGYCGGVLCKSCTITFIKDCSQCCTYSHWEQEPTWLSTAMSGGLGVSTSTPIVCNQSNFSISSAVGNCTTPTTVIAAYACNAGCSSNIEFKLYNTVGNVLVASSTSSPFTIPTSLPNGSYCITIYAYCGGIICDSCKFCFVKNCDECCTNSHWAEGPTWLSTAMSGGLGISTVTPIICGQSQFAINNVIGNCTVPTTVTGAYVCGAGCTSSVVYNLYKQPGNVLLSTSTGSLTIPVALPNGSYSVTIYAYCGTKICDSCKFTFVKNCTDCCKNSKWSVGPHWINENTGVKTLIKCGTSRFNILSTNNLCFVPFKVKGTYLCGSTSCASLVTYELKDSTTGLVVSTSNDSLMIPVALPNGTYFVTIKAYCGGILCNTCTFVVVKNCECDCGPTTGVISVTLNTNGSPKSYKCGAVLPIIDCKDSIVMSGSYACNQTGCPASYTYILNGPFGTTSGSLPLTLTSLSPGTYSIYITAYCGGKICKECKYNFTVKCDTVPPPPCCPYEIGVVANAPLYAILSVTPQLTTAVVSENFSFSGIAGIPITELRAEVVSYSLSSNYMNECMSCRNYPRNWASVSSGTKIDTITPKITLFGGATTTSFTPTASNVFQNPRELIWNNGGSFAAPDSVAISFLIPGPSPIDCCVLNGRICVKFTFRDIKCRECEVIACFPFRISQENGGVIYTRE